MCKKGFGFEATPASGYGEVPFGGSGASNSNNNNGNNGNHFGQHKPGHGKPGAGGKR